MRIFVNEFCGHPFQMALSRELARRGHHVWHVYFADNDTTPKGDVDLRPGDPPNLNIEGLHIQRKFSKHSLLTRRAADVEYGRVTAARMEQFAPDIVISANMPLDAQQILMKSARSKNAHFVFWLQDVYSVAVRFVLQKKAKLLAGVGGAYFESLEKKLLKSSDAVVCIAPGFADYIEKWNVDKDKINIIENWAPLDEVKVFSKQNGWSQEHGIAEKFSFIYSGTLGMKHRPELLLALAKYLSLRGKGVLVVVAGGAGADWLAANSVDVDPKHFQLLPFQPYERISEVFGSSNVLITLLDSAAGSFAVPSKAMSYLCAGRAQLVAAPRENAVSEMIERAKAGIVVDPDSPEPFLAAAAALMDRPDIAEELGRNARSYALANFDIQVIAQRFEDVFDAVLRPNVKQ